MDRLFGEVFGSMSENTPGGFTGDTSKLERQRQRRPWRTCVLGGASIFAVLLLLVILLFMFVPVPPAKPIAVAAATPTPVVQTVVVTQIVEATAKPTVIPSATTQPTETVEPTETATVVPSATATAEPTATSTTAPTATTVPVTPTFFPADFFDEKCRERAIAEMGDPPFRSAGTWYYVTPQPVGNSL